MKTKKSEITYPIVKSHFVMCDGGCELIQLDRTVDVYTNDEDESKSFCEKHFEFSMWNRVGDSPLSFRQRLRWCWNILRTGMPWADMVILSDEKVKNLAEFIYQNIAEPTCPVCNKLPGTSSCGYCNV